jgi:leucyl-tRNA synthetase
MFSGRYDEGGDFSDQGIEGVARFIQRVWELVQRYRTQGVDAEMPPEAEQLLHRTIRNVTRDIAQLEYNTCIAFLMEYLNALQQRPSLSGAEVRALLLLLAPFAPYVTEELWEQIGGPYSIHNQPWPQYDEALAREREVAVAVQINGKTRDVIQVATGSDEAAVVELARRSEKVQRHLNGEPIARTIFVADRLVNFVLGRSKA